MPVLLTDMNTESLLCDVVHLQNPGHQTMTPKMIVSQQDRRGLVFFAESLARGVRLDAEKIPRPYCRLAAQWIVAARVEHNGHGPEQFLAIRYSGTVACEESLHGLCPND